VLTASELFNAGETGLVTVAKRLRVRDARTGQVLVTFTGTFQTDWLTHHAPYWESSKALLLEGYEGWRLDPDDGPMPFGRLLLRCDVDAAGCEQVSDPPSNSIVARRD
jgi:hypothetical protein